MQLIAYFDLLRSQWAGRDGTVGAGASATDIPTQGRTYVAGAWANATMHFMSGELAGTDAVVATNTPSVFTLAAALAQIPAAGDRFILNLGATVNVQVNAPENVAQWGGAAVAPALAADGLVPAATDLVALEAIANQAAATNFASFTAAWAGTATVLLSLATASVVNLMATPSGGVQASLGAIQDGSTVAAAQPQTFAFPISKGAAYALQVVTAQTGNLFVHVKGARR